MEDAIEWSALVLASGKGLRFSEEDENGTPPPVIYGGRYRAIDFPLNNCRVSGIGNVGIVPFSDRVSFSTLKKESPSSEYGKESMKITVFSSGSFNKDGMRAGRFGLSCSERFSAKYVLLLSDECIYRTDYRGLLAFHKENCATCTVLTAKIPGMTGDYVVDENNSIHRIGKTDVPLKNRRSSVGAVLLSAEMFCYWLSVTAGGVLSDQWENSIVESLLSAKKKVLSYPFTGYVRRIVTEKEIYSANRELLFDRSAFSLADFPMEPFFETPSCSPQIIGDNAIIRNALVASGCKISGTVENSVLFTGVTVEAGAVVKDAVLAENVKVSMDAVVRNAYIGKSTRIEKRVCIGDAEAANGLSVIAPYSVLTLKGEKSV